MVQDASELAKLGNWTNYFITSGGRIWGVSDEEKINGEAQERRNIMGNCFKTPEEACLVKAKQKPGQDEKNSLKKELFLEMAIR